MDTFSRTAAVVVFGVALFVVLIGLVALEGVVGQNLTAVAQPIATLVAGLLGLGAIAWQANRGFRNLIESQEHRASIERQGRLEQADLARQEREAASRQAREDLASALRAEIWALYYMAFDAVRILIIQIAMLEGVVSTKESESFSVQIPSFSTPIFERRVEDIGLLGESIGADVIQVYALASRNVERSQVSLKINFALAAMKGLLAVYEKWPSELEHVAGRLGSISSGLQDPGTLFDFRRSRDAKE